MPKELLFMDLRRLLSLSSQYWEFSPCLSHLSHCHSGGMYQAFPLPPVWALMWSKKFFCFCSFCVCYLRSGSTVSAAWTIPGSIFGTWSTKRSRVMGKGMVTFFFQLTFLLTLRGHPLWRQPSYGVMVHIWLTRHKYSPYHLNFRSLL